MLSTTTRQELYPPLERLCRHLLQDGVLARETAEDLWTDFVLHHAAKVSTPGARAAYLHVLAVRHCRRLKTLHARQVPLEADGVPDRPADAPSAEAQLIAAQRDAKLADCMQQLDPSASRLLRLRYHLGLTQESIGDRLGVSKQYAGRILARAVDSLRTCVEAA
ncbi:MAG: sigma-70 family RNA polymerase sigma factor [Myxococcaceae bacterium]|nr:sigma-70 family RNA polymerase sigma factor [Myxococcaceae bacterium]